MFGASEVGCNFKLQFYNVLSLWSTVSFNNVEFYALAFVQRFETFALDCGEVYEYIASTFNFDETETFFCVKPFNCTFQVNNLLKIPPSMANIHIILHAFSQCN